jgi:hypothetical protein
MRWLEWNGHTTAGCKVVRSRKTSGMEVHMWSLVHGPEAAEDRGSANLTGFFRCYGRCYDMGEQARDTLVSGRSGRHAVTRPSCVTTR